MLRPIQLLRAAIVIGIGSVFYLSWTWDPHFVEVRWMPEGVARWGDQMPTFRTAVPFFGLGGILAVLLDPARPLAWLNSWLLLCAVVLIAEAGQLFLPLRTFDVADILWGCGAAFVALAMGWGLRWLARAAIAPKASQE